MIAKRGHQHDDASHGHVPTCISFCAQESILELLPAVASVSDGVAMVERIGA